MSTFKKIIWKEHLKPLHTNRNIFETVYYYSHEPGFPCLTSSESASDHRNRIFLKLLSAEFFLIPSFAFDRFYGNFHSERRIYCLRKSLEKVLNLS